MEAEVKGCDGRTWRLVKGCDGRTWRLKWRGVVGIQDPGAPTGGHGR